tara:strand:+ start:680 stop:868 length:189 start_codon:yes stop_codon:yes gene_type:complete
MNQIRSHIMQEIKPPIDLNQEISKIFERSLASIREKTELEIREAQAELLADRIEDRRRFQEE